MRWDLFCRVIDNFGDVGVGWRLARRSGRARRIGAAVDRRRVGAGLDGAPTARPASQVGAFDAAAEPGDVVVETFGCDPPPAFVAAMRERRPVWINLEYLSAEAYVERSPRPAVAAAAGPG